MKDGPVDCGGGDKRSMRAERPAWFSDRYERRLVLDGWLAMGMFCLAASIVIATFLWACFHWRGVFGW